MATWIGDGPRLDDLRKRRRLKATDAKAIKSGTKRFSLIWIHIWYIMMMILPMVKLAEKNNPSY